MSFQQSLQATAKTDINEDFEIIDRSALDSSANELADQSVLSPRGSKNLPKDMIGALATSMSSALQLPINPPRKDTPILPTYRHGGSPPMNSVRLETPSPLAAQEHGRIESTAETETGEALSATTEPVLGKAHTTVIESSNRPVGHRSSPSLRHIVFSSRTTSTPGVYPSKEGQEDNNSSTESFVKILPPEGSPDRAGGSVATFASRDRGTSYSQGTARQSDPHDDSELAATLEAEDLTIGRGRSADRQATTHPLPEDLPRTPDSDMASSPESSVFVHGILPAISSPSLSFLIDSRSTTSSVASSDNLARSYNSAEDPNNLKYWWEAGIRDGDPVGSPLHRYSPPSRQSSNALGNESRGISSPASIDQIARMSTSQAIAQAQEHDCRDQAISQDSTIVRPLPVRRESKPDAGQQMSKSDSDESVEQGRELKYTLSDDVLFKGKTTVENALLEMPSGEAGVARDEADGVDATGGPTPWLEPLGMLLHEAPDLQVDGQYLQSITTSRLHVKDESRSLRSVPSSLSDNGNVGILSPDKQWERPATPSTVASVDPSDLHISYELRPWDPMVNGAYITFKFLLYLLANTLRCQPNQLPYLPITSYIAKFAMVPELDLRRLFSNELSYAVVADHHLTHHELFLWYKQIFRSTTQDTSGTFQDIISVLIQVGLEHPVEPIEYTLQKLQSNPNVICLLPPGGCSVHDEPEDYPELQAERRPRTSYGSVDSMLRNRIMPSRMSKDIIVEMDTFAYDIKEDLDLSSSSESSSRLSSGDIAASACSRRTVVHGDAECETEILNTIRHHSSAENQRLNEVVEIAGAREKGKAKAKLKSQTGSLRGYSASSSFNMEPEPVATFLAPPSSLMGNSSTPELLFSDSRWNLLNRVLGLLSYKYEIPWHEVLKKPRCVAALVHDAGVSVDTFGRWVLSAESEEKAEREEAKLNPGFRPWRASTDFEGRWNGLSFLAAMYQILPMKQTVSQVSQMPPFHRAVLHLVRLCDRHLERQPVEETYMFLRGYFGFLEFEPWSIPNATRNVIRNLRTHLESASGNYLAPEAKEELKEFVRVQELQIGSSTKDWQGDEAMGVLQNAQMMMG